MHSRRHQLPGRSSDLQNGILPVRTSREPNMDSDLSVGYIEELLLLSCLSHSNSLQLRQCKLLHRHILPLPDWAMPEPCPDSPYRGTYKIHRLHLPDPLYLQSYRVTVRHHPAYLHSAASEHVPPWLPANRYREGFRWFHVPLLFFRYPDAGKHTLSLMPYCRDVALGHILQFLKPCHNSFWCHTSRQGQPNRLRPDKMVVSRTLPIHIVRQVPEVLYLCRTAGFYCSLIVYSYNPYFIC